MKFIVTILESYSGHIIRLFASFFAAKHIPVEDYGLFATLVAGYTFATVVGDFGFNIRLLKGDDKGYWMNIFLTASAVSVIVNILILSIFQLGSVYIVAFPLSLLALTSEFCSSIILSTKSYYLNAFSNLLGNVAASALIIFMILFAKADINILIYSVIVYYAVRIVVMVKAVRVAWPEQYDISFGASKSLFKRNWQVASPSLIENTLIRLPIIILAGDKITLGQYSFANQIIELVSNQYVYASNRYVIPRFKEISKLEFNDLFKRFSLINYFVGVLLGLLLFFVVPSLLTYFFGEKWNLASYIVQILALGVIARPIINFMIKIVLVNDMDGTYMVTESIRHLGKIFLPFNILVLPILPAFLITSCLDFLIFIPVMRISYKLIPNAQFKINIGMFVIMAILALVFLSQLRFSIL